MALFWAAGIIWLAVEVAGPGTSQSTADANATDASGARVTPADEKALQDAINAL